MAEGSKGPPEKARPHTLPLGRRRLTKPHPDQTGQNAEGCPGKVEQRSARRASHRHQLPPGANPYDVHEGEGPEGAPASGRGAATTEPATPPNGTEDRAGGATSARARKPQQRRRDDEGGTIGHTPVAGRGPR